MLAEALQKFADLIATTNIEVTPEARPNTLSSRPMHNAPLPEEPNAEALFVSSIEGLIDVIPALPINKRLIVCAHDSVSVISELFGVRRHRDIYAVLKCRVRQFGFENYHGLEAFRVGLLTQFTINDDLEKLLEFTASLTAESANTLTDDGVSQKVQAKIGIASSASIAVPSPCKLLPVATFREVEQPERVFVLRMRKGQNGAIEAGLFEHFTDWQRTAALRLVDYIRQHYAARLGGLTVVG